MITRRTAAWLLTGGVIGPVLFVVVFLVMGWTRLGYDPMSLYLSYLSRGDGGWLAIATTVVSSLLTASGAVGLRCVMRTGPGSRWGPILIGITGVGLVLAGIHRGDDRPPQLRQERFARPSHTPLPSARASQCMVPRVARLHGRSLFPLGGRTEGRRIDGRAAEERVVGPAGYGGCLRHLRPR